MTKGETMIPQVSVIICTYNRLNLLKKTIQSVLEQDFQEWELIVVNNNSNDGTEGYVQSVGGKEPRVKYVLEIKQGLSYARNCGAELAQSNILAYLDDDEEAEKDWVRNIYETFQFVPNIGVLGGPMVLQDKEKIKCWISPRMYSILGEFQLGSAEDILDIGDNSIVGGNMTVSKEAWAKIGGFAVEQGRKGSVLLAGEDVIICKEAYKLGYRIIYNRKVGVRHALIPERMVPAYFFRNALGLAKTRAKAGKQVSYLAECIYRIIKLPFDCILRPRHWFFSVWRIYTAWHKLVYSFQCEKN